ncbi:RHS repeat-associated protein [Chryseobacterium defluvii]|uniref:RHS repeat-associated protein n=1 Tax=Chryseobacterium defluvii TaxID=160396 RepID=A0A840KI48_9FLAO|nr:RHS repeat-associated core domain-containing protein [Chryseobacterium defluvii]MBB4807698.1 RHS repeat-associated protein [Chryseobacterium defluvii]
MRTKIYFLIALFFIVELFKAQGVGQTGGTFSVSLTGGAGYSVPIKALPGIKDIVPNISLSYTSQGGNGSAGWGWNIDGLSSITRVSSTKFHDGAIDPVDMDEKDRFTLDGQRLVLKSGTYGSEAEYQLENYSNIKIVSSVPYWPNTPSHFLVYYPNGSVAKYLFDGANKFEWRISYIEDINHNTINFSYSAGLIDKIEYGGNSAAGTPNINKINFYYSDTSRRENAMLYGGMAKTISKKLDRIEILSGSQLFRKYQLTYNTTSLNYDRLTQIQEYNGSNETIKPIIFEYDTTENGITNNSKTVTNVSPAYDNSSWQYVSGYFDKDSSIDFMTYPNSKDKLYRFNSSLLANSTSNVSGSLINVEKFTDIFSTKLVLPNQKFYNLDAVSTVVASSTTVTDEEVIKINSYVSNSAYNSLDLTFNNSFTFPTADNQRCIVINGSDMYYSKIPKKYFSGDFDGDGVSDIIALSLPYSVSYTYYCDGGFEQPSTSTDISSRPPPNCCTQTSTIDGSNAYFLKLDPNNSAVQQPLMLGWNNVVKSSSKIYVGDFDGDGKSDLYVINSGKIYVYTVENNALKKIHETTDSWLNSYVNPDNPYYVADFNGDGKTDIVIPAGNANTNWFFYIANGETFTGTLRDIGTNYYKPQVINTCYPDGSGGQLCGYMLQQYYYTFADINGDGKADLFYHDILTPYNYPQGGQWNYPYNHYGDNYSIRDKGGIKYNMGSDISGLPTFSSYIDAWQNNYTYGGATNKGTPIFLSNSNIVNQNLDYAFFGGDKIKYVSFKKDNRTDVTLKRIKENDILTTITYSPLIDNGNGIYTEDNNELYPYVNINVSPSTQIVSKVTKSFNGETKIQDYKYKGAVTNLEGLGFLGFKGVATSSVYGGSFNQPLWTITKQDPQKRGANTESYLLNNNVDFNSPSGFITKSVKTYNTSLLPNKVFVNLPSQIQQIDNLTGVTKNTYFDIYDSFNNVIKSRDTAPGGEKTTLFEFENNYAGTSNQYFIGRPIKKTETRTLGNETYSSEQTFEYANNLLTQSKKKGHGTDYITEDYEYDTFGNVTKKTLSTTGMVPRTEEMEYDPSGRFIVKSTNILGFEDVFNYNTAFGLLMSETNYLNQTTSYEYDGWQKKIKEKDIYNNYRQYSYEWITAGDFINGIKLKVTDPTGATKETFTDNWGRKRLERVLTLNNEWLDKRSEYDIQDREYKISDPYFSTNSPTRWTITEFDEYGRVKKVSLPTGKVISSSYNGLSVTVVDGQKTQTITSDAWGNKITMTDNGGTVNYSYFANGGLKSSNYQGHVVNIEQDGWGRKTKLTDPSVGGDYMYEYDKWGQMVKEENPKGKTHYIYDQYGRVIQKTVAGDHTDININYSYNSFGFLNSETGTSNGINNEFNYKYDNYHRIIEKREDNGNFIVRKNYTYDGYGRTSVEATETEVGSTISNVAVENMYASCGALEKIKEVGSGTIIWQINNMNEKGQILGAALGNGTEINNSYDSDYFVTSMKHNNGNNTILENLYNFDPVLNTLKDRTNHAIQAGAWSETFEYDNLQRLITWTDPNGTQSQSYDSYGRIDNNSKVGDYKYEDGNRYRKKGINLNSEGNDYYSVNQLQQIQYNAYKSPVTISKDGTVMTEFEYNIHQSRSSSLYDYHTGFGIYRSNKYYSDDKTVEVLIKNSLGRPNVSSLRTRIITYVGGDPYTAPAMHIKDFNFLGEEISEGMHYLHRDYQGTIMAISNQDGSVEEKRHFDPWGNLVYLEQDGIVVDLNKNTPNLLIERGYTGHEHFFQVGLIHMNGRMYDPKLHTFLSVDNHIQDPFNTQSYNRFGYVMNNPLMYTDPSGELAFIPILIGMAYGALVGAAIAVVTYSIPALLNGSWNWKGLGTSVLYGAISGAISGGISGVAGQMVGSFWQSTAMNMITSVAAQVGTSAAFGDSIGWGTIAGAAVSAFMGAKMDAWSGMSGGWLANAAGELIYTAGTGALVGAVSGTLAAALSGKDIGDGMKTGMRNGAYGGASRSIAMIGIFGATYKLEGEQLEYATEVADHAGFDLDKVAFRRGGLYQSLISRREVTWGRNIVTNSNTDGGTIAHELTHYIQGLQQGWAVFQARGIYEQFLDTFLGVPVYNYHIYGDKYQESQAQRMEVYYRNIFKLAQ